MANKVCDFDGCEKPNFAHGYCSGHAAQIRRGQELRPLRQPRPDAAEGFRWCSHCQQFQPLEQFTTTKDRDGLARTCNPCRAAAMREYNARNREKISLRVTLKKWGLTESQYQALFEAQRHRAQSAVPSAERLFAGDRPLPRHRPHPRPALPRLQSRNGPVRIPPCLKRRRATSVRAAWCTMPRCPSPLAGTGASPQRERPRPPDPARYSRTGPPRHRSRSRRHARCTGSRSPGGRRRGPGRPRTRSTCSSRTSWSAVRQFP